MHHNNISWKKYIDRTSKNKVRPLLVEALQHTQERASALDIGGGALNESKYLLSQGFGSVTAMDADEAAEEKAKEIKEPNFNFVRATYTDFKLEPESYDLINAQYALPFNGPEEFNDLIERLKMSLKSKGIFVGNLFGERDSWNIVGSKKIFHTNESAHEALDGLDIIVFREEEKDEKTALGQPKHWHLFNFIARKR
ncbi:MAG: class I SAM-dependent methyltransferase [bacterium]|nr:class I SAM-dependent methyltransferase [bacterium]